MSTTCFSRSLTGPERINPSMEEISRCIPETMQEKVNDAIKKLTVTGKMAHTLYKFVSGSFAKNCKKLAEHLKDLDIDELLSEENIAHHFNKEDKKYILEILKDKNSGLESFIYTLENLNLHILGYIDILDAMLNKNLKLDIIALIHTVDLIQRSALEIQEKLQLLTYLKFAQDTINGYDVILAGMRHQFSFKVMMIINALNTMTEDLRCTYLSLLDKGSCSDSQIAIALGIYQRKKMAIKDEDE